ncbi:hypothetical protein A2U01_0030171, partial [Trifolium medium]|nr:hypothetical protein [Trifolium medium]
PPCAQRRNQKPKCPKQSSPARREGHPCALRSNQKQNHPNQLKVARCAAYPRSPHRCQKKNQKDRKHGALRHTAGRVAPRTETSGNAEK